MEKQHKSRKKYTIQLPLLMLLVLAAMTLIIWLRFIRITEQIDPENGGEKEYARHYVLISDNASSQLWQDIYSSAKEAAAKQDAYLELLGGWTNLDYSAADYMNIAAAEKVDGIIVKPDGTVKLRKAIDEASARGIPVITVLNDESSTARKSFVGVNSYQLGTEYGRQVLKCMNEDTKKITVLLNQNNAGKELVFKQLRETVQEGLPDGREVEINSLTILPGTTFDAEEVIRDLLHDEQQRPDILVCMSETDSECAYYAMIDYNQVGEVELIGYYQSANMLGAVQKGVIPMVVAPDVAQVGKRSIEALEEYCSMGYVSSYLSVDLNIITKQNVNRFLPDES